MNKYFLVLAFFMSAIPIAQAEEGGCNFGNDERGGYHAEVVFYAYTLCDIINKSSLTQSSRNFTIISKFNIPAAFNETFWRNYKFLVLDDVILFRDSYYELLLRNNLDLNTDLWFLTNSQVRVNSDSPKNSTYSITYEIKTFDLAGMEKNIYNMTFYLSYTPIIEATDQAVVTSPALTVNIDFVLNESGKVAFDFQQIK